jgi:NADH dehydrogenase (ubiquinone) flavoprotein 2
MSHGLVVHQDTDYNNANTPFDFTPANYEKVKDIVSRFPSNYKQSAVIPLLWLAQEQGDNWLPLSAMNKIAELLDVPPIRVYETASFYTMFNRTPVGKYHIQLCGTTPCMIRGAEDIKKAIQDFAHIEEGGTSKDGLFTLTEVECLGACVNAPMIQVNNQEFYEWLTPEIMTKLMEDWKAGRTPKPFNQNHVKTCEGPMGKTTLKTPLPETVPCRDLDALAADLQKARQAEAEAKAKAAEEAKAKAAADEAKKKTA